MNISRPNLKRRSFLMKNRMLVEFTLCKSFGLKPNPIYLSAIDMFMHYVVNFPLLVSFTHLLASFALLLVSFTLLLVSFTLLLVSFTLLLVNETFFYLQ
jgi:hypothetical protein